MYDFTTTNFSIKIKKPIYELTRAELLELNLIFQAGLHDTQKAMKSKQAEPKLKMITGIVDICPGTENDHKPLQMTQIGNVVYVDFSKRQAKPDPTTT